MCCLAKEYGISDVGLAKICKKLHIPVPGRGYWANKTAGTASLIPMMILGAQSLQLIASVGLIAGIYPRQSALALLLFLIPATLMAHAFWQAAGTPLYTVQLLTSSRMCAWLVDWFFSSPQKTNLFLLPRSTHAPRFGLATLANLR